MIQQKAHGDKERAIVRALTSRGVVLWDGIPERIIEELYSSGYKIKKRKKLRSAQRATKSSTPSLQP
jgi:hypothetical protein